MSDFLGRGFNSRRLHHSNGCTQTDGLILRTLHAFCTHRSEDLQACLSTSHSDPCLMCTCAIQKMPKTVAGSTYKGVGLTRVSGQKLGDWTHSRVYTRTDAFSKCGLLASAVIQDDSAPSTTSIDFFEFATGNRSTLLNVEKQYLVGIALSPDQKSLL
jgi:hypothetical protein